MKFKYEIKDIKSIRPCGCSIKVDLDEIVYPVLDSISQKKNVEILKNFNKRVDAWINKGRFFDMQRFVIDLHVINRTKIIDLILDFAGNAENSVIELNIISSSDQENSFEEKKVFENLNIIKFEIHLKLKI